MDVKETVEKVIARIKDDGDLKEKFLKDPVKALEDIIGKDLPDEQVKAVLAGVKEKIGAEKISDVVEEAEGKIGAALGGLFHKKEK